MALEEVPVKQELGLLETACSFADQVRRDAPFKDHEFPAAELLQLSQNGLLSAALPSRLGGSDLTQRGELLFLLKEIGRANLPLGRVFEGHVNALLLLNSFASESQLVHAAHRVLSRGHVLGVWNTGPAQSPSLTPLGSNTIRMSGAKTFATGANRIHEAIVTAALPNGGWQMCLVPLTPNYFEVNKESWQPLGMEATESYTIHFPDVTLSTDSLIGQPGDYYAEPLFTSGAFRFCAVQLGAAQALFDAFRESLKSHNRADDPFQLQRLAQAGVLLQSSDLWLSRAAEWLQSASLNDCLVAQSQMMRIATEEICTRIAQIVEVGVGARGLTMPEPFARTIRDLMMYLRQGGFDQAFQVVGRHLMRGDDRR